MTVNAFPAVWKTCFTFLAFARRLTVDQHTVGNNETMFMFMLLLPLLFKLTQLTYWSQITMEQSGLSFEVFDESFGTCDSLCSSPGQGSTSIFTSTPKKNVGKMLVDMDPEISMCSDVEVFDESVGSGKCEFLYWRCSVLR